MLQLNWLGFGPCCFFVMCCCFSSCLELVLAFLSAGLTPDERGAVVRLRSLVRGYVSALCGDLEVSEMWKKYGAFNSATKNFDFHPDW